MRFVRVLAVIGAVMGGGLAFAGAPAAAAPTTVTVVTGGPAETYVHRRSYRVRHYVPRRTYYVTRIYPRYHRPRLVCRVRYYPWGVRRVCKRRW